jgi:hypothetical protein
MVPVSNGECISTAFTRVAQESAEIHCEFFLCPHIVHRMPPVIRMSQRLSTGLCTPRPQIRPQVTWRNSENTAHGRRPRDELLARAGIEVGIAEPVQALRQGVDGLLTRAQQAGAVRGDVQFAEVMALLTSTGQGAFQAGWDDDLRHRTLSIIFNGLRPAAHT